MPSTSNQQNKAAEVLEHQNKSKKKGMEAVHMALAKLKEKEPTLHSPKSQLFFASRKVR